MVTIDNNTVTVYLNVAKREDVKSSHHKEENVLAWGDGC